MDMGLQVGVIHESNKHVHTSTAVGVLHSRDTITQKLQDPPPGHRSAHRRDDVDVGVDARTIGAEAS